MKKNNLLWIGIFNYAHELETRYTYAPTWASAKTRMLRRMAVEHNVGFEHVFSMFNGDRDNFKIEMETTP
jgi:hypothetical protein